MNIIKPNLAFNGRLVPLTNVTKLVQHHPAHRSWSYLDIHLYHRDTLNWIGGGYNYFIAFDGTIYEIRGLNRGAHARDWNSNTIGIAYQGHFGHQQMTDEQLISGSKLNAHLAKKYNLTEKDIIGHRDIGQTACPDRNFREKQLVNSVARRLRGKGDDIRVVTPNPNQEDNFHKVQSGDTLSKIARDYGTTVEKLKQLNPQVDPNAMSIGLEIVLIEEDVNEGVEKYTIQSGDTMWAIANSLDVSVEDLVEMNPEIEPTNLKVGEEINVPKGLNEVENAQEPDIDESALWTGIVTADGLNVRSKAGMNGSIVRVAQNGESIEVFEERNNWLKISDQENEFVHRNHVERRSEPSNVSSFSLPTETLRRGDRGASVKRLQRALNKVYFKVGKEDGIFGAMTEDGLKRFQSMYAPPIDGVYGRKTRSALDKRLNK